MDPDDCPCSAESSRPRRVPPSQIPWDPSKGPYIPFGQFTNNEPLSPSVFRQPPVSSPSSLPTPNRSYRRRVYSPRVKQDIGEFERWPAYNSPTPARPLTYADYFDQEAKKIRQGMKNIQDEPPTTIADQWKKIKDEKRRQAKRNKEREAWNRIPSPPPSPERVPSPQTSPRSSSPRSPVAQSSPVYGTPAAGKCGREDCSKGSGVPEKSFSILGGNESKYPSKSNITDESWQKSNTSTINTNDLVDSSESWKKSGSSTVNTNDLSCLSWQKSKDSTINTNDILDQIDNLTSIIQKSVNEMSITQKADSSQIQVAEKEESPECKDCSTKSQQRDLPEIMIVPATPESDGEQFSRSNLNLVSSQSIPQIVVTASTPPADKDQDQDNNSKSMWGSSAEPTKSPRRPGPCGDSQKKKFSDTYAVVSLTDISVEEVEQLVQEESNDITIFNNGTDLFIPLAVGNFANKTKLNTLSLNPEAMGFLFQSIVNPNPSADEAPFETSPEQLANVMHTIEKGIIPNTVPAEVFNSLFAELKYEEAVKMGPVATGIMQDIVVPLESPIQIHEETNTFDIRKINTKMLLAKENQKLAPKSDVFNSVMDDEKKKAPKGKTTPEFTMDKWEGEEGPWGDVELEDMVPVVKLVGAEPRNVVTMTDAEELKTSGNIKTELEKGIEYFIETKENHYESKVSFRGHNIGFPGYYFALPHCDDVVQVARSPSEVFKKAWQAVHPDHFCESCIEKLR